MQAVLALFLGPLGLLTTVFWVWMLYDCLKNERDRHTWIWLLIFLNVIGALLYFVMCWVPRNPNPLLHFKFAKRWTMRDALWQAEAEAKNIGKAHQYIKLGNILYDMGDRDRAAQAYTQALDKEPENSRALWGMANVEMDRDNWEAARHYLKTLIHVQPDFSYGDGSLAYGRVLVKLGDLEAANAHLASHIKAWGHPEAYLAIAQIYQQQGNATSAREALETMIIKIKSSTPFQYRKNRGFVRQGEKMLRAIAR